MTRRKPGTPTKGDAPPEPPSPPSEYDTGYWDGTAAVVELLLAGAAPIRPPQPRLRLVASDGASLIPPCRTRLSYQQPLLRQPARPRRTRRGHLAATGAVMAVALILGVAMALWSEGRTHPRATESAEVMRQAPSPPQSHGRQWENPKPSVTPEQEPRVPADDRTGGTSPVPSPSAPSSPPPPSPSPSSPDGILPSLPLLSDGLLATPSR